MQNDPRKNKTASGKRYIFQCGCETETPAYDTKRALICKDHGERVSACEIKCRICGTWVTAKPTGMKRSCCDDCRKEIGLAKNLPRVRAWRETQKKKKKRDFERCKKCGNPIAKINRAGRRSGLCYNHQAGEYYGNMERFAGVTVCHP